MVNLHVEMCVIITIAGIIPLFSVLALFSHGLFFCTADFNDFSCITEPMGDPKYLWFNNSVQKATKRTCYIMSGLVKQCNSE